MAAVLLLVSCLTGVAAPAPSALSAPSAPSARPLDEYAWVDPEETAALLARLAAAGVELSPDDLARLVGARVSATTASTPVASRARRSGQIVWRNSWNPDDPTTTRLRVYLTAGPVSGRLRAQATDGSRSDRSGTVNVVGNGWRVVGGGAGMQHGFGLLAAAPGRWHSLSASASLAADRPGLTNFGGAADRLAVLGGGVAGQFGTISCAALVGRPLVTPAVEVGLLRCSLTLGTTTVSALRGATGATAGTSLAFSDRTRRRHLDFEFASWRSAPRQARQYAWAAGYRLRLTAAFLLEGQCSAAGSGEEFLLARRPATLPGWDGWGWVIRCRQRLGKTVRVWLLAAGGHRRDSRADTPLRLRDHRREFALEWRCRPELRAEFRVRRRTRTRYAWSTHYPWQPAAIADWDTRLDVTARLEARTDRGTARLDWRTMYESSVDGPACRHLVAVAGRWFWQPQWLVRAGVTWSWGDALDLVSAANPLTGMVLPRHWGKWALGTNAGLEKISRRWRVQLAVARRERDRRARSPAGSTATSGSTESAAAAMAAGTWEVWLRVVYRWR